MLSDTARSWSSQNRRQDFHRYADLYVCSGLRLPSPRVWGIAGQVEVVAFGRSLAKQRQVNWQLPLSVIGTPFTFFANIPHKSLLVGQEQEMQERGLYALASRAGWVTSPIAPTFSLQGDAFC